MTLPFIPKFSIGDKVFIASVRTVRARHTCPDCGGTRVWKITSPHGDELDMDCPRCTRESYNSDLSLDYSKASVEVRQLTIGSVRLDTLDKDCPIQYLCVETGVGSGSVYREEQLHDSSESAEEEAERLRAERQTLIDLLPTTKSSELRSRLGYFGVLKESLRGDAEKYARRQLAAEIEEELPTSTGITPGVWRASISRSDDGVLHWEIYAVDVKTGKSLSVGSGYGGLSENFARSSQGAANAMMIAAAPRLFRALQVACDHLPMDEQKISHAKHARLIEEALSAADHDDNVRIEE